MSIPLAKGTPVISLADGTTLGTIDRVFFDPESKTVVGFTFHQGGGLFSRGPSGLVEIGDVQAFGPDAVTITDVSVARSELIAEAHKDALIDLETLLTLTVITDHGTRLGRVVAIEFGDTTYRLSGLMVTMADVPDPVRIPADDIQIIGDEVIVVAEPLPAASKGRRDARRELRVVSSPPAVQPETPPKRASRGA